MSRRRSLSCGSLVSSVWSGLHQQDLILQVSQCSHTLACTLAMWGVCAHIGSDKPVTFMNRNADDVSPVGILSLATYLRFWGWTYLAVTLAVAALKHEVNFRAPAGALHPKPYTLNTCRGWSSCTSLVTLAVGNAEARGQLQGRRLRNCTSRVICCVRRREDICSLCKQGVGSAGLLDGLLVAKLCLCIWICSTSCTEGWLQNFFS